jgi:hypothetical protein
MKLSFIIVTNGAKAAELELQVKSILRQNVPEFEIITVGNLPGSTEAFSHPSISHIQAKELTDQKLLGALRNRACQAAKYDYLVISDDDMLFSSDWYRTLLKAPPFEILTGQVRLPDGGRFWDHTCYQSPTHGHQILEKDQDDEHLYMSGGQSWIMHKKVFETVQWGEQFDMAGGENAMSNIADYQAGKHNEDTDFSEQCRKKGFKITHHHDLKVWHNDNTYTTVGRYTRRRTNNRTASWVLKLDTNFPPSTLVGMSNALFATGFQAEGLDLARHALSLNFKNPELEAIVHEMNLINGGVLSDVDFDPETTLEFRNLIDSLDYIK